MTIQKPDFNQIFASQAPDIDKPPVFNNYNGGMGDEYRPNNGKPTIKGFNYLQQLNDNKFLWMVQNGAFPYDPNTEYAVGVVTIKDGRFKQWDGTNWINFGQDDDALKSENNLSDLPNKTTARNNLDVYSKIEVDNAISSAIPSDVPNATETTAGKAKIATTAIAQAGTNDTDIMTPAKVRLVSFGQGQTRKSRTLVNNVSYTNSTNKPIVLNYILASTVSANAAVSHNFHIDDFVMKAEELSGTAGYRFLYTQIVLPNETYKLEMLNGTTYIVSAWEIS